MFSLNSCSSCVRHSKENLSWNVITQFSEILKIKTSIKAFLNMNNVSYLGITQKDRESTPFSINTFHCWEWILNLSFWGDTIWAKW